MAMTETDRTRCSTAMQRFFSQAASTVSITKVDLRAAVDAIDDWCDAAATTVPPTSFNAAIPQPARTALTSAQKAILLAFVCLRRAGELRIPEDG